MSILKFQSKVQISNTPTQNQDGSWRVWLWVRDGSNTFTKDDVSVGDTVFFDTNQIEKPSITSFTIVNIHGFVYNTLVDCDISYDSDNDNTVQITSFNSIDNVGVISKPTSNLNLSNTIAPGYQTLPDWWAEYVSNINLQRLDDNLSSIIGLDSNGDYVPQGSSSSTSISDDIQELFQTLSNNSGNSNVTVSATAPESPSEGDLWYDSENLSLKIFYGNATDSTGDDVWVEISSTDSFVVQDGGGSVDLSGYVTQSELDSAGYLTSSDLSGYATNTELSRRDSHLIHVDQYKSGTYTPDGSINKPYKTIQAAYDSAVAVSTILIAPGLYEEDLVVGANGLSSMINFIGLGGKGSNNAVILGNVEIHDPQTKVQMKDIRIESPDGTRPALLVNGCRNSSFQNMTIKYGVDSEGNTVVPTENVLKVTSSGTGDGIVDFLSCSIHPQTPDSEYPEKGGILVDGPNFRQVRFYRCNYGANITMPSTNMDTVYLYQCAAFGNITHQSGVIVVDQSQITGFYSEASITPLKSFPDYLQNYTLVNFVQITNSSLRLLSGGWGTIEKYGDSNYLIGNNDSNPNQFPPLQSLNGDSLGEVEYQKALDSDPNADIGIEDYMGQSYLRHASEIHYSNKNNPWGQIENESIPYDVESALESLKGDLVDIHYNLYSGGDILVKSGVRESFTESTGWNNTYEFDMTEWPHIFHITNLDSNIVLKLTNLGLSFAEATTITVVIEQGANAYIPNELHIEGASQTIKWQGGAVPSGTVNGVDVISFSILRKSDGSYLVLGQLVDFSSVS